MATIEFFRIKVNNKDNNKLEKINLLNLIQESLEQMSPEERFCKNRRCDATIASHLINEDINSITYDFIKFTQEVIHSALSGKPDKTIDTFQTLENYEINSAIYSTDDVQLVKNTISNNQKSLLEIKKDLEQSVVDNFKIYKIIRDENLNKSDGKNDLLNEFHKSNLKHLKTTKTFFNITHYSNHNILMLQKVKDGFDFKKLEEYLNLYILKKSNFTVNIDYIYESDFMDNLQNAHLKEFNFSFNLKEKSILDDNNFNNIFYQLFNLLGKQNISISTQSEKDSFLNNEDLLKFFRTANQAGLFTSAKIRKNKKFIPSTSNGSVLDYTNNLKIEDLTYANQNFLKAFEENEDIIKDKIWLR